MFLRNFFFGSTFAASWFLMALAIGVVIVYLLKIFLKKDILVVLISLSVYLYISFQSSLPAEWRSVYDWYNSINAPTMSFPIGLLWISIGYIMSSKKTISMLDEISNKWIWGIFVFLFVAYIYLPVVPITKMLCVVALFMATYTWQLPQCPLLYKRMRTYSILFYVIHDPFHVIPRDYLHLDYGLPLFLIVVAFCFAASEVIIRLSQKEKFVWLKYAY